MTPPENPQAFKHMIGPKLLKKLASALVKVHPDFPAHRFVKLTPRLEPLEMKDRVRLIRDAFQEMLPPSYPKALPILLEAAESPTLEGFDLWPMTEFVQTYGLAHFKPSMSALHFLTRKFTAEFAVRPFLKEHPDRTFTLLRRWAEDSNHHVRRCASEGTRPRLPWGERVPGLIESPERGLELLEVLRFDPELYVRKSVANHLNDVSKDHPEKAEKVLRRWKAKSPPAESEKIEWIVRHALRTLIKKGRPEALALIGVKPDAEIKATGLKLSQSRLRIGDTLEFEFDLQSTSDSPQKLVVDYIVGFMKARGDLAPKVFKLKTFELPAKARVSLSKRHSLRPITTRVYYPGKHLLEVQVNGTVLLRQAWSLI